MTRKQRIARAVYAAYVVLVAAFVASSIAQVARRVFGASAENSPVAITAGVGEACARVLTDEIDAIEVARTTASGENGAEAARSRYLAARPSREPIALASARCENEAQGAAALAALARFDRAAEADALRAAGELSPVRLAAQSFIRGHTR